MRKITLTALISLGLIVPAFAQYPGQTPIIRQQKQKVLDSIRKIAYNRDASFGNRIEVVGELYINPLKLWTVGTITRFDVDQFDTFYNWQRYHNFTLRENILLAVKLNPKLLTYHGGPIKVTGRAYPSFLLPDGSPARVFAMGIIAKNVGQYRYHVVINDSAEVVPWSVPKLEKKYTATEPYGIIGDFAYPDKKMLIEVVNTTNYNDRAGILIDWRTKHTPVVIQFTGRAYGSTFSLNDTHRGFSKTMDPATRLPKDLNFPATSFDLMTFDFEDHETVPYYLSVITDSAGKRRVAYQTRITTNHYELSTPAFNTLGKHEIIISADRTPVELSDNARRQLEMLIKAGKIPVKVAYDALRIPFFVRPLAVEHSLPLFSFDNMGDYAIILLAMVGAAFGIYYLYNKRKLNQTERERAMAAVQLKSVRSQLNPHFMFNALTSIQNLMNQRDTEGANHYLSKFAGLTRQILKTSNKEMISVYDELKLITDYLEMEQLRFGFKFIIEVDPKINKPNTDIPAMLIQPFIENAAKHGMSVRLDKGKIDVIFTRNRSDIIITIQDNGPGFSTIRFGGEGHGLSLTQERIKLLNQLYPDQLIFLDFVSNSPGTKITITLTNWV